MTDRPADGENSSPSQRDQIVAEKQIAALNMITERKASLARIKEKSLTHARLDRWRVDTGRLIAQTISRREAHVFLEKEVPAVSFSGIGASLSTAIALPEYVYNRSQHLDALAEAIQENPDFYFDDQPQLDLRRDVNPEANTVYIMYGDRAEALELQNMLRGYDLNAQLLGDKPLGSLTLIQMLEESCEHLVFVFVILTNDETVTDTNGKVEPRARPNAMIELGYYLGRFGQLRVAVLCTQDIFDARPSDVDGVFVSRFQTSVVECADFVLSQLGVIGLGPKASKGPNDSV